MAYENLTGLPSVTTIISPYVDVTFMTEAGRDRGSCVHDVLAAYLTGLFCPAPPDEWKGYCDSGNRWIDEMVENVDLVEKRLIDERLKYCGKPDLIATLKGRNFNTLIDFKTGQQELKSFRIQNSAYRNLAKVNGIPIQNGMTVRLKPDGSGALITEYPANHQKEMNIFQGLLNSYYYFLK